MGRNQRSSRKYARPRLAGGWFSRFLRLSLIHISSGGILIQAMPDCSEELLDALEIRAELFSSISQLLSEMTLEEIVEGCFRGLNPEILDVYKRQAESNAETILTGLGISLDLEHKLMSELDGSQKVKVLLAQEKCIRDRC